MCSFQQQKNHKAHTKKPSKVWPIQGKKTKSKETILEEDLITDLLARCWSNVNNAQRTKERYGESQENGVWTKQ